MREFLPSHAKIAGNSVNPVKVTPVNTASFINLSKVERNRAASFQTLTNKELENILSAQTKVGRSSFPSDRVKTGKIPKLKTSKNGEVILFNAGASCKEQKITESWQPFFEIQTIGLEQDGPLLKKEALWKR